MRCSFLARVLAPLVFIPAVATGCGDQVGPANRTAESLSLTIEGIPDEVLIDTGVTAAFFVTAFNESGVEVATSTEVASSDPLILTVVGDSVRAVQVGTAILRAVAVTRFRTLRDSVIVTVLPGIIDDLRPPVGRLKLNTRR